MAKLACAFCRSTEFEVRTYTTPESQGPDEVRSVYVCRVCGVAYARQSKGMLVAVDRARWSRPPHA